MAEATAIQEPPTQTIAPVEQQQTAPMISNPEPAESPPIVKKPGPLRRFVNAILGPHPTNEQLLNEKTTFEKTGIMPKEWLKSEYPPSNK